MRSFLGLKENYIFQGSFSECVLQSVENGNFYSHMKEHFIKANSKFNSSGQKLTSQNVICQKRAVSFYNFHTVCQSVGTNTAVSSFLIELK